MSSVRIDAKGRVEVVHPPTAQELAEAEAQLRIIAAAIMRLALGTDEGQDPSPADAAHASTADTR